MVTDNKLADHIDMIWEGRGPMGHVFLSHVNLSGYCAIVQVPEPFSEQLRLLKQDNQWDFDAYWS